MPHRARTASRVLVSLGVLFLATISLVAQSPSPEALAEASHWKRVRAIVEPRVKANPNDAEALSLLARVKEVFGDRDGALPLAEKAVALDGRNATYHLRLADLCGSLAGSASLFRQMSLGNRFKSELQAALAIEPKNLDALWAQMQFYWQAPGLFGGDKEKARQTAQRIGQINAARGYLAQAQIAVYDKQTTRVEELFVKAVEADPRSYQARMTLANFCAGQSPPRCELAEQHASEAMSSAPDRAAAYATLARVYARQHRTADLERVLADAERNVPDNLSPFLNAANALLAEGTDLPRAESYVRKYLSQEREGGAATHGVARWRLALVLEKEGRKQEAIAEADNAARLEPKREDIAKEAARLKKK
jgi:tetratricopeptide (TPR) repeat protein